MTELGMSYASEAPARTPRYRKPASIRQTTLDHALREGGREGLREEMMDFLRGDRKVRGDINLYLSGDIDLLQNRSVAIVGTREVTEAGWLRAARLARELAHEGIVVTSGLAKGVDTAALTGAIQANGRVTAVIGTPLDKAYPAENSRLQEEIYLDHLLISPFPLGEKTYKSSFPKRNRVMAALTDATVIVEASDTSGTLHQAAECLRLGRWLFILRSVAEDMSLSWPKNFIGRPNVEVLTSTSQILRVIR